jgi:hypothetical protein
MKEYNFQILVIRIFLGMGQRVDWKKRTHLGTKLNNSMCNSIHVMGSFIKSKPWVQMTTSWALRFLSSSSMTINTYLIM